MPPVAAVKVAVLAGLWVLTRLLLLTVTRARELYPYQDDPFEVSALAAFGDALTGRSDGPVPLRDGPWEYPPGAALVLALPSLLRGAPYALGLGGTALLLDAVVLLLLAVWGLRRGGSLVGAGLWVAAVPLLGPVALARFDLVPTGLAVGGLLAAAAGGPVTAGALLAAGTAVKLWPVVLLPLLLLLHRRPGRVAVGALLVGGGALLATLAWAGPTHLLAPLEYQRDRGLEVESVPGLALMAAFARGEPGVTVGFGFGSYQVDGPSAGAWKTAATVGLLVVLVLTAVLAVRARRRGADAAVAVPVLAVLLVTGLLLTDTVLSPQYLLWPAGLLAVALATRGSPLLPAVAPLAGALVLTQAVYPLAVRDLLDGQPGPVLLLGLRDLLLAVVLVVAVRAA